MLDAPKIGGGSGAKTGCGRELTKTVPPTTANCAATLPGFWVLQAMWSVSTVSGVNAVLNVWDPVFAPLKPAWAQSQPATTASTSGTIIAPVHGRRLITSSVGRLEDHDTSHAPPCLRGLDHLILGAGSDRKTVETGTQNGSRPHAIASPLTAVAYWVP